jgi:hypothetical protein
VYGNISVYNICKQVNRKLLDRRKIKLGLEKEIVNYSFSVKCYKERDLLKETGLID